MAVRHRTWVLTALRLWGGFGVCLTGPWIMAEALIPSRLDTARPTSG